MRVFASICLALPVGQRRLGVDERHKQPELDPRPCPPLALPFIQTLSDGGVGTG